MAGPLETIERFFERLFERPAARLFQAPLEPIHLRRHLERAMEVERQGRARQTFVPSDYQVILNPADMRAFEDRREALATELAQAVRTHARGRGYTLVGRPRVEIGSSTSVPPGDVVVRTAAMQLPPPSPARKRGSAAQRVAAEEAQPAASGDQVIRQPPAEPVPASAPETAPAEGGGPVTSTFRAPEPNLPRAILATRVAGRAVSRLPVRGGTIRIGRAPDNDIVLADERTSRHHGQIGVRLGMLVYTDLGSTNGSYLNGSRVTEIALGPGDQLQLGSSTLTIEPGP